MIGLGEAVILLLLNSLRVGGWTAVFPASQRLWILINLAGHAVLVGALAAAAMSALALVRARRSPGAALVAAALAVALVSAAVTVVATWSYPMAGASRGWRHEALAIGGWVTCVSHLAVVLGLCAAAWDDRAVRVVAPGALGAALLAVPPPPLSRWLYETVERGAMVIDGGTMTIDNTRMWMVPGAIALASAAWGAVTAWLAQRQPLIPADAMAPRPASSSMRWLAASFLAMVAVAVAAGLVIAVVQGKRHADTGILPLLIPVAVGLATAGVGSALLAASITDVGAAASRRFVLAAICVWWEVVVVAGQTLWSRKPQPPGVRFTVFEAPWMPGMAGAVAAVAALLFITSGLAAVARQAGQRPGRAQGVIVVLALVIGAATVPWVLGFGTRTIPIDGLRIATLASAALINLASWIAIARVAWRVAAALER